MPSRPRNPGENLRVDDAGMTAPHPPTPTRVGDAAARIRDLVSFQGKYRILHLTWFAFFLSFVVWFNFAPFANTIAEQLALTEACLLYTSPSPRDGLLSRMPSSA